MNKLIQLWDDVYYMEEMLKEVIKIRRELHMYPETGFCEYRTSKYISDYLKKLDFEVIENVAKTGVIGILRGNEGRQSIAVRADMDCLTVSENTGCEYSSKVPGLMHACGHDGHMAILLGLAKKFSTSKRHFKDNIIFIFQPAEEGPGGAKAIVDSGILDDLNVKAFIATHVFPELEQGTFGCCSGPLTARNGEVDIHITGKSAHGAMPHKGIDSIVIMSELIGSIQTIVSRRLDPLENAVLTFGKVYGGEIRNVIAGSAEMEGTIRAFSEETYNTIKENINMICSGLSHANNCRIDAEIRDMYHEVCNDKNLFETFLKAAGRYRIQVIKPLMIAEDFSFYSSIAPELMFMTGSRNEKEGYTYPLHSAKFNLDEHILLDSISIFDNMIMMLDQ